MKRIMVFLLILMILAVGLALPSTALAAKAPAIDIRVMMVANPSQVPSGGQLQLEVHVANQSQVTLADVRVEIPKIGATGIIPESGDTNGNLRLEPGEQWRFSQFYDYPTHNTRYVVNFQGVDPNTSTTYTIDRAASESVRVTR